MGLVVSQLGGATLANDVSTNSDTFYIGLANNQTTGSWTAAYVSTSKLYYNPNTGTVSATNFNSLSDLTLKEDVSIIDDATSLINKLRGVTYRWKDNGKKSYGVIAQELEEVIPELVDGNDKKTVNYNGIIGILINTVKEQNERIEALEKLISK